MSNQEEQQSTEKAKEYYDKGVLALDKQNYDYAVELFAHALSLKHDFPDARHMLRVAVKKKQEANPPSKLLIVFNQIKGFLPQLKAGIFESKNEPLKAIEQYEKILRDNPVNTQVLNKLAKVFLKENHKASAIKTFEEILDIDAKNLPALKNLGELYSHSDEYQKAKTCYERVLKIHPRDPEAEKGLKNLDALGTIRDSFTQESPPPSA